MKTAVIIPARLGATRLPRKPLRTLGGEPLVVQVWRRVSAMDAGDAVVIATDSDEIASAAVSAGAQVILTSADCSSGTARVAEVAAMPAFSDYGTFVNVQGDEPFIAAEFVRGAVDIVRSGRAGVGTAAALARSDIFGNSSIVKVVTDTAGRALYFSRAAIPYLRDEDSASDALARVPLTLQHVGVYSYTREALARWAALPPHPLEQVERLEQLRPLANGMDIGVAIVDRRPENGIDTEDDLQHANERWRAFVAEEMQCQ